MTKEYQNPNPTEGQRGQASDSGFQEYILPCPDRRVYGFNAAPYFRELSVACALSLLLIALAVFAPTFFSPQPLLSRLTREAPSLVVACGIALVIISRQIDISVGSQFSVCSVCAGLLAASGWSIPLVLLGSIFIGAVLGAFNGILIAGLRLPSIVVTLATMVILRESLRWARQGQFVNLPDKFQWFGLSQQSGQIALITVALLLVIILILLLRYVAAGRFIYAVGSDAEAARLAGIHPQLVTFLVFVFTGALVGLASLMNIVQSPQVDPNSGSGLELKTIAAAVVGGVAISGGRGNLVGVFLGLLLLGCISPALIYLRVEAYWEKAIQGAIILLAVVAGGLRARRQTL
jgi:rhamnose transport system permease protein